jgi:hypothetical protein
MTSSLRTGKEVSSVQALAESALSGHKAAYRAALAAARARRAEGLARAEAQALIYPFETDEHYRREMEKLDVSELRR